LCSTYLKKGKEVQKNTKKEIKIEKSKRQRGAKKKPHKKKSKQKETKTNSEVLASIYVLVLSCIVACLN